ncbi:hypothetical protein IRJ41_002753 [Triplophysa rosa]|uniref:Uncharacterized protein n=1 Tax=Triplophysa rosa TaxID=992332 RepID=A0A9W8C119_TRIRA|nr:hypothetical protein IRJ41_002753 [Triplophysa rosa]
MQNRREEGRSKTERQAGMYLCSFLTYVPPVSCPITQQHGTLRSLCLNATFHHHLGEVLLKASRCAASDSTYEKSPSVCGLLLQSAAGPAGAKEHLAEDALEAVTSRAVSSPLRSEMQLMEVAPVRSGSDVKHYTGRLMHHRDFLESVRNVLKGYLSKEMF